MGKDDQTVEDCLNEMEDVLKKAEVSRLALTDGSKPYIVSVNFLYHSGKIVFHCAWNGRKLELIKMNPECCLEVDEFRGEATDHYQTRCHLDYDNVPAFGKARIENARAILASSKLLSKKTSEVDADH